MPKFNDINLDDWKNSEVWTDSLWLISERDKTGKHSNFYHGNFIPQIPRQLILRYTKKDDIVLDPFLGSGTTAYECESLKRNFIGIELQSELAKKVDSNLEKKDNFSKIICGDSKDKGVFLEVSNFLKKCKKNNIQLVILHPPYFDILKFSNLKEDLSNTKSLKEFLNSFSLVLENTISVLKKDGYVAIVIGDKYTNGEWVPLGFHCMNVAQKKGLKLKSVIIKNIEGNRGKMNQQGIWRYRALSSDYYIFKHEYIFLLKKTI